MSSNSYRPDVDGLRAIAVMLVLLFHAHLGVPGGFVGVDVFFVISGYLITGLILRDLARNRFSLAEFWTRRIRRIVPASLVMALVTLCVGTWLLSPQDFEELGKSAIAQPLMVANFFFWQETGYFDGPADLKPLLHTWSLAVEEQFYLFYPLLLMLLARSSRRTMVLSLGTLSVASFVLSLWGVNQFPSAAFFLLPFRAWEMLLGGLLCFLPEPARGSSRWMNGLGIIGLLAIAVPSMLYDADTPFPGLAALWPCLGAALVIHAGGHAQSWVRAVLGHRLLVGVGLMSYSLYLWHWPIIVYLQYRLAADFSPVLRGLALVASFLAAYGSWRWVETPLRYGEFWQNRRRVFISTAIATSVLILAGVVIRKGDGWPGRFSPEMQRIFATMQATKYHRTVSLAEVDADNLPIVGDQDSEMECLLWGDSHAMTLIPALEESCRELGIRCYQATHPGTLPFIDYSNERDWAAPPEYGREVYELLENDDIEVVILAGYWSRDSDNPRFRKALNETVQRISATGARVVIVKDVPIQEDEGGSLIAAPLRRGSDFSQTGIMLAAHRRQQQTADAEFARLTDPDVVVIDPAPWLVDVAGRCRIVMDGECLYFDQHHLSLAGSRRLKPMFLETLLPYTRLMMQRGANVSPLTPLTVNQAMLDLSTQLQ